MHRIWVVLALLALAAGPLRAQQDPSVEEAKAHAARAKVHYDLGEYRQAAEEYILVYRLRPVPAVLFNIAQSYRKAAEYDRAKQFYESYLREASNPTNRASVEKAIREIDELLAKEKKAKDGPPTGIAQEPGGLTAPPAKATAPAPPPSAVAGAQTPPPQKQAAATPTQAPQGTTVATAKPATPAGPTVATASPATQPAAARSPIAAPPRAPTPLGATAGAAPRAGKSHTAVWIAAGAPAAALAAGGVFGAKTLSSRSSGDASKANLLYGIGGGLAVLTGALFLLDF
jgi:tetratricopeptide (TPR) repeat protein